MKFATLIVLFVLFLAACAPVATPAIAVLPSPATLAPTVIPATSTVPAPGRPAPTMPSPAELKNASYTLSAASGLKVTLVNGEFEVSNAAKTLVSRGQLIEPVVYGDLNGDGAGDAVVIIAVNNGGSGTFHELIVLLAPRGQSASRVMGDRISEKKLSIQDGNIVLDYIRTGPKDPMCCPTQRAVTTLQYSNGELLVLSDQVMEGGTK